MLLFEAVVLPCPSVAVHRTWYAIISRSLSLLTVTTNGSKRLCGSANLSASCMSRVDSGESVTCSSGRPVTVIVNSDMASCGTPQLMRRIQVGTRLQSATSIIASLSLHHAPHFVKKGILIAPALIDLARGRQPV